MPEYKDFPVGDTESPPSTPNPDWHERVDSSLRLIWWLVRNRDSYQFAQRTGLVEKPHVGVAGGTVAPAYSLPITFELNPLTRLDQFDDLMAAKFGIPRGFRKELETNAKLKHVAGTLPVDSEIFHGKTKQLEEMIELALKKSRRATMGVPAQPCRGPSLGDIGLPEKREYKGETLTGKGVVIGIIDDGCALAHRNFIRTKSDGTLESRILYLWDQGASEPRAGWDVPKDAAGNDYTPGLELRKDKIDAALNLPAHRNGNFLEEELIYSHLNYCPDGITSHGTHVLDIAAGNGEGLMESDGVACDADIIFVQLPPASIEAGARHFEQNVMAAATYIFQRAAALAGGPPAVINISYGGYDGPHDGTSELEQFLDALLGVSGRAIVVAAGNGFEANCHASETVMANAGWYLRWMLPSEDPTDNSLEIWYDRGSSLEIRLQAPEQIEITPSGWIPLGNQQTPIRLKKGKKVIGYVEHLPSGTGNQDAKFFVNLRATDAAATAGNNAPSPSGTWKVELRNRGNRNAVFHSWIHRDDSGRSASARRRQSCFHEADSKPGNTVTGWSCGSQTIAVGAYNVGTREVCSYSACGPARFVGVGVGRAKPDIYAPAEETVRGGGVLSASSRSARPSRMNGTSAAAPHVAGLIALIFEYAVKQRSTGQAGVLPTVAQIRDALVRSADRGVLMKNRHQLADARVPIKQEDVWGDLVASGKVNLYAALKDLFP